MPDQAGSRRHCETWHRDDLLVDACSQLFERKQAALDAATDARRSHQSREDFSASLADYESACVLYSVLSSHLGPMLDRFGFPRGELGIVVLLAVAKAHGAPASTEAAFVDFFHGGSARFELIRAVSTSVAPAFAATDAPRLLIVAFSSLGSWGLARPEWRGTLREVGRFHDVLHVLDPAASWWVCAVSYECEVLTAGVISPCTRWCLLGCCSRPPTVDFRPQVSTFDGRDQLGGRQRVCFRARKEDR